MNDPSLDPSRIGELAEEFLDRRSLGERPTIAEYAEKYPELAEQILAFFPALLAVENLKPGPGDATGSIPGAPGFVRGWALERLGDFRIIREVGRGGMGIVYEAEQESLGRRVALKVLGSPSLLDPKKLARFDREAKAAARLHHTNIVPVFGVGEAEGVHFYVMQFIAGAGLDEVLEDVKRLQARRSGRTGSGRSDEDGLDLSYATARSLLDGVPVPAQVPDDSEAPSRSWTGTPADPIASSVGPAPSVLSAASETGPCYARSIGLIGVQVAEALAYAHEQGILHRDIKPSNILLDPHGTAWVTDFGLAKTVADDDLTHTGDIVGTIRYMAPERFHGRCDARSDVYALGLTLYEMLARLPAFNAIDRNALIHQVSQEEPIRLRKLDPTIPRDLETIIHKAIEKEPGHRYPTADDLAEDLRRFLEDRPIRARRSTLTERTWRWSRRNRATAALAATAAGSLVLAAIVGWAGYVSTRHALDREEARRNQAERATHQAIEATRRAEQNEALSLEVFEELFNKLAARNSFLPPPPGPPNRRPSAPASGIERNRFDPDGLPPGDRVGPPRPGSQENVTALLQSVLTFYERFAQRNATNPRLQGEAARAYRKVGAIYQRLHHGGQSEASEKAIARSLAMFEELVAQYPENPEFRHEIVETSIMADPWEEPSATLGRLEERLRRAQRISDRLNAESPGNELYMQTQVHVQAKLGATLQRLKRDDEAEACYRRAIDLAGTLIDQFPNDRRARRDRAGVREALALLLIDRGRNDEARTFLATAADDLRSLVEDSATRPFGPFLPGDRFESLAEIYTRLGDTERAREMTRWAEKSAHPHQDPPGRGPEPPRRTAEPW